MNIQRLAAILLISGFVAVILHTLFIPPGLYETLDAQTRVEIIEEYKTRWKFAQPVGGLSRCLPTTCGRRPTPGFPDWVQPRLLRAPYPE
jgi:hypothetical protein